MKQIEDKSLEGLRKKFIFSLVLLGLAVAYLVFPIDFIPDVLVPAGYLDDIPMLIAAAAYAGYSYRKMKKEQEQTKA
ncbi:MAG TPA: YkvA family protein [Spirochaetota bacterium]|jgi:uncharacterized membrane protein YkvA (DUF1232 family)|nr:YkvA family protein [Spirochaetota bacterium]HPV40518.1 YkvA family protein [Spirochaetota bacterium]